MSQPPMQPQQPRPQQPMQMGQPQRPPQMMGQPQQQQQPRPMQPGQPMQMQMGQPQQPRPQQPMQMGPQQQQQQQQPRPMQPGQQTMMQGQGQGQGQGQPQQQRPQQQPMMMQGQPQQPRPQMQGQGQPQQPRPQMPMQGQPQMPIQGQPQQPRPQQPMQPGQQPMMTMQGQSRPQQPMQMGQPQQQQQQQQQPRPMQPQQPQQAMQQPPQQQPQQQQIQMQQQAQQLAPPQRVPSQTGGQSLSPSSPSPAPASARSAPSPTPSNGVVQPVRSPSAAASRPERSPSSVSSRLDRREREPELRSDIKDIWQQVIEFKTEEDAKTDISREATILFLGPKQSGKSTLISAYMFKDKSSSVPAPTTSLEYKYTRSSVGLAAAELSHFWELGGGRSLVSLLDVATNADQVKDLLAVIVLDLSKPSRVVDDLNFWIKTLRTRLDVCLASKSKDAKDSNIGATLMAEARKQYGDKHPDINQLDLLPIPLLIIGAKYDMVKDRDTELLKVLSKTLRAMAHTHGASLIYTDKNDAQQLKLFRARISRHMLRTEAAEKKVQQIEHTKPIAVPVGSDSFAKIGDAPGKTSMQGFAQAWQAIFPKYFPATPDEPADGVVENLQLEPEPYVDQELARRDEVLAQVRRDAALKRKLAVPV